MRVSAYAVGLRSAHGARSPVGAAGRGDLPCRRARCHYHLVVEARREELSGGMQLLNGDHAQTFNLKYGRCGHLFGERFWSRLVENDEQLVNTCKYVLENPV